MIRNMNESERSAALTTADIMAAAARTAPKANGLDKIMTLIASGDDLDLIAREMEKAGAEYDLEFFARDASNLRKSHCAVLIAAMPSPSGVPGCNLCGFGNCTGMIKDGIPAGASCSFSATDLGIAIGSAVTVASANRIDNRVMYSVGRAAIRLGLFPDGTKLCYGIPLYTGAKSIFFDRASGSVLLGQHD